MTRRSPRMSRPSRLSRARGFSLVESMISVLVLCFGVLGLTRLQAGLLSQGTDAQRRLVATGLAEEVLSMARVDVLNAPCYTWPAQGACASDFAKTQTSTWAARAVAAGYSSVTVVPTGTQLKLTLSWSGKVASDAHKLEVITDVAP